MFKLYDYPVSVCARFVRRCHDDGCAFTAYIPQTGELMQTDSLKQLFKLFPSHLKYGVDPAFQEDGCFVVADHWGNIYYWIFNGEERHILRCSVVDGYGIFDLNNYWYMACRTR